MSSQLHEAVRLAQAGRRDEARQLLRQVVQADPNNEMAWLWLASVAADNTEYQRALTEVLRVNPTNQQARQLLGQFQQQFGTPPPQPRYTPPASQPAYYAPQTQPPGGYPAAAEPRIPIPAAPPPGRRGGLPGCGCLGCGCGRSCLLLVLLFLVLPAVLCAALSYSRVSLGPVDELAVYLPGDFGRKNVEFEVQDTGGAAYQVSVTVPRSWMPAIEGDYWWDAWRRAAQDGLKFRDPANTWAQFSPLPGSALVFRQAASRTISAGQEEMAIVETNPITLTTGGAPSGLLFNGLIQTPSTNAAPRQDEVRPVTERIFEDFDAPDRMHLVTFTVPVNQTTAAQWIVIVPESQYQTFKGDIERIIETAEVRRR